MNSTSIIPVLAIVVLVAVVVLMLNRPGVEHYRLPRLLLPGQSVSVKATPRVIRSGDITITSGDTVTFTNGTAKPLCITLRDPAP